MAHSRFSPKAISKHLLLKKKEHEKGALHGIRCRTSFCYNCDVTIVIILLFFRSYYDGPLVTVAMETRPAVPDWTVRGLPLEAIFRSCCGMTGRAFARDERGAGSCSPREVAAAERCTPGAVVLGRGGWKPQSQFGPYPDGCCHAWLPALELAPPRAARAGLGSCRRLGPNCTALQFRHLLRM